MSNIFLIKNLWDIIPAKVGDKFLSMLPPWHAYEGLVNISYLHMEWSKLT